MSFTLKPGTTPELNTTPDMFHEQIEDGCFWSVPKQYFTIEYRTVKLDAEIASRLEWNDDGHHNGAMNINARADTITIDGEEIHIAPGAFCSWIRTEDAQNYR